MKLNAGGIEAGLILIHLIPSNSLNQSRFWLNYDCLVSFEFVVGAELIQPTNQINQQSTIQFTFTDCYNSTRVLNWKQTKQICLKFMPGNREA